MKCNPYYRFFSNLSNPLRIDIVKMLKDNEASVNDISKELGVEQSKVSHALANLRACNIVDVSQDGKRRIYSLNKDTIVPILNLIDCHAAHHCHGECCTK
jgi:ArsR family transcriptional regulator, zinc-responsive transcriptional repressor